MSKYRKLMVLVALIAALTMLATMTGVSFAAGGGTTDGEEETTCVVGYVINHRELVVDGTKFDPQLSVMYEASSDVGRNRGACCGCRSRDRHCACDRHRGRDDRGRGACRFRRLCPYYGQ